MCLYDPERINHLSLERFLKLNLPAMLNSTTNLSAPCGSHALLARPPPASLRRRMTLLQHDAMVLAVASVDLVLLMCIVKHFACSLIW